jgi:sialate O-acetylesterase
MRSLILLVLSISLSAEAATFDPVFSPGMVLQRGAPIRLSGKGSPGGTVIVSLDETNRTVRVAEDGTWSSEFPAMKAGGPHVLKAVEGADTVALADVLCGDVWLCSGQSNMQMGVGEVIGGKEELAGAAMRPNVRIFTMPRGAAEKPVREFDARWQRPSEDGLKDFSAVAWFFGKHLMDDPALEDVPLGLINSSFGGTSIEAWTPPGKLPDLPKDQISGSMFGIAPGSLFNGMISPLTRLPIKGVLWYQGEANAGQPQAYISLLANLMDQWRTAWQQPELPFFIVQLPAFEGTMGGLDFSWLREAQAAACAKTQHAWCAVTFDTTDGHDLHPVEKEEIGRRLALLARRNCYQSPVIADGPAVQRVMRDGRGMRVTFESAEGLATKHGKLPAGFALAGADGEYRFATAVIEGPTVIVDCADVPDPRTLRHAWGAMPDGNLVNRSGLPVAPFRTDSLAPTKGAFQPLPAARRIETPLYRLTTGDNGQVAGLIVRDKQFLSNEARGGTWIPDGFGARNFRVVEELGPRRLRMSDGTGSLEIACADDSMEWIVRNDRDSVMDFRLELAPKVAVRKAGAITKISRDGITLEVEGTELESGCLIVKIPPRSSAVVKIRVLP